MHGYTWLYGQLLQQRYNNFGSTNNFQTSNVCVNGNSTVDVLARWKADFINNCGKYALLALSLGNEGIHENGQPSFDSYRDNLQLMIAEARNADKIPVVTNSYTRGDFNATDYEFIKAINLLIHEWNVPSVNLLGAIDNGAGVWADNYWSGDIYHPNDAGHAELFHALVPSLFDALEINKPIPTVKTGTSYTFNDVDKKGYLQFTPEDVIHSFTISFDVKTSNSGTVASFDAGNATIGKIEINADGNLVYSSPISGNITSSSVINNNAWHKITLTHYYAWGKTMLYIDDALVNTLSEQILATNFYLNGKTDFPTTADYRNLLFYRSAMNIDEVEALAAGSLLKSSLEIYAPLDEAETYGNKFSNYAQSLNTVQFVSLSPTAVNEVSDNKLIIFPNPATDKLQISAPKSTGNDMQILDIAGKIISTFHISNSIDISSLSAGIYFVKIDNYLAKFIKK
jgi:lysophospholipase L1-like esterase